MSATFAMPRNARCQWGPVLSYPGVQGGAGEEDPQSQFDRRTAGGPENVLLFVAKAFEDVLVNIPALRRIGFPARFCKPISQHLLLV